MANAAPGFKTQVKIIPQSAGTKFQSANNAGGELYTAGTSSEVLAPAYSTEWPTGFGTLDATTFEDEAESIELGLKTGDLSLDLNYKDGAPSGLSTFRSAFENREPIEVAVVPDEGSPGDGYEMTAKISELSISSEPSGKVEMSATLQCSDGDGWSRLST